LDRENTISKLLQNNDKAEFLEFVNEHIEDSEKCLVIFMKPDGNGGLKLFAQQFGFKYVFELEGFTNWVANDTCILFSNDIEVEE